MHFSNSSARNSEAETGVLTRRGFFAGPWRRPSLERLEAGVGC